MQKKYLITTLAIAGLAVGIFSAGSIQAQSETGAGKSIIQRLAERFNLNEADVQGVFDEHKDEMRQEHQQMLTERLNNLVSEGKLTENQKNALLEKLNEMRSSKEEFRDLSREEMRTQMEARRTELETWLKENNIDMEDLGINIMFHKKLGPKAGGPVFFERM